MSLHKKISKHVETRTRKSERTRERIVAAAREFVLERRGVDFQMAEVAAACGMTKGALYYYFRDRTALVEEVFDRAAGEFLERIEGIGALNLPAHETLEALCGVFADEVRQGGAVIVALATELAGTTGALSRLEMRVDRISAIVEEQLKRAREQGEVRDGVDLGLVSSAVCGAFLFAAFRRVREQGDAFDAPTFSAELMSLVSHGLADTR
ncbi:MAG: TetR/AcrR family transcriptional regulator [Atopobiaceae bacterium]|nr:TetR/AcrR family transcriptional regulator [Atopobiaceae bacterium]